jgi:hypothetical protein
MSPHSATVRIAAAQPPASSRFERLGRPALDGFRDDRARRGAVQRVERGRPVAGRVGTEADPAVGCGIVSGDRVPGQRQRPSDRLDRHPEPERGRSAVDGDRRRVRNCGNELGNRQRRRTNRAEANAVMAKVERRLSGPSNRMRSAATRGSPSGSMAAPRNIRSVRSSSSSAASVRLCVSLFAPELIDRPPAKGSAKHVALSALNQS